MAEYGIKVSTVGNNANEQSDKRLSYSSDYDSLKIFAKGKASLTTNGAGIATKRIFHGIGYPPAFRVFRQGTASFSFLDATSYSNVFAPEPGTLNNWLPYHNKSSCYADGSYLTIYMEAAANTQYDFSYFIFIDESQQTVLEKNAGTDAGLVVTKPGLEANAENDYKDSFKSTYRSLRYFPELTTDYGTLSLPAISGDYFDGSPREGTYIDFFHRLGYPPFFLAFGNEPGSAERLPIPFPYTNELFADGEYEISAWCDKSRIRVTWQRRAGFQEIGGVANTSFSAQTLDVKLYIFEENLDIAG